MPFLFSVCCKLVHGTSARTHEVQIQSSPNAITLKSFCLQCCRHLSQLLTAAHVLPQLVCPLEQNIQRACFTGQSRSPGGTLPRLHAEQAQAPHQGCIGLCSAVTLLVGSLSCWFCQELRRLPSSPHQCFLGFANSAWHRLFRRCVTAAHTATEAMLNGDIQKDKIKCPSLLSYRYA